MDQTQKTKPFLIDRKVNREINMRNDQHHSQCIAGDLTLQLLYTHMTNGTEGMKGTTQHG